MNCQAYQIAQICYESHRAYSATINQLLPTWDCTAQWLKDSFMFSVEFVMQKKGAVEPAELHADWLRRMQEAGWKQGDMRAPDRLEHPGLKKHEALLPSEQIKARLLIAIVKVFMPDESAEPKEPVKIEQPKAEPIEQKADDEKPADESPKARRKKNVDRG